MFRNFKQFHTIFRDLEQVSKFGNAHFLYVSRHKLVLIVIPEDNVLQQNT